MNQRNSTKNVTDWFKKTDNKKDCTFIQFDIKELYPAGKAINFVKEFIDIESSNLRSIHHCRKSLVFHITKHGKRKVPIVVSTLPWEAMMAPKSVN